MYPRVWAQQRPDDIALTMAGSGETVTWSQLEDRSSRLAQLWWRAGVRPGDHVAVLAENHPRYLEVVWAAMRSGLYLTPVDCHLTTEEAAYVIDDCGAVSLVVTAACAEVAERIVPLTPQVRTRLMIGSATESHDRYEDRLAAAPSAPLAVEPRGEFMIYSSGTTGRPKGIQRSLSGLMVDDPEHPYALLTLLGVGPGSVMLVSAPLYHSFPMLAAFGTQMLGGSVVVLETFDPLGALRAIERHRVTHSEWVPTHFVRMLKLPERQRCAIDVSSQISATHSGAPCPVEVKREMIDWWGPIIGEVYGGTENNGLTYVDSAEWLRHPGTVGRAALGTLRICDEQGTELPPGEIGIVYFERAELPFRYHNDADQTASVQHPKHPNWTTLFDVGFVDEDGYLHLTDRQTFMIVSGGVNIYPQEIENRLVQHPKVLDVAVFGVPNADLGEETKAVVQPADGVEPSDALAADLLSYAARHLARYKVPRSVDFARELPRSPTGKLHKRVLRDPYWR